jgi:hypothetical protein
MFSRSDGGRAPRDPIRSVLVGPAGRFRPVNPVQSFQVIRQVAHHEPRISVPHRKQCVGEGVGPVDPGAAPGVTTPEVGPRGGVDGPPVVPVEVTDGSDASEASRADSFLSFRNRRNKGGITE